MANGMRFDGWDGGDDGNGDSDDCDNGDNDYFENSAIYYVFENDVSCVRSRYDEVLEPRVVAMCEN